MDRQIDNRPAWRNSCRLGEFDHREWPLNQQKGKRRRRCILSHSSPANPPHLGHVTKTLPENATNHIFHTVIVSTITATNEVNGETSNFLIGFSKFCRRKSNLVAAMVAAGSSQCFGYCTLQLTSNEITIDEIGCTYQ